jgi:hypothetical protein
MMVRFVEGDGAAFVESLVRAADCAETGAAVIASAAMAVPILIP